MKQEYDHYKAVLFPFFAGSGFPAGVRVVKQKVFTWGHNIVMFWHSFRLARSVVCCAATLDHTTISTTADNRASRKKCQHNMIFCSHVTFCIMTHTAWETKLKLVHRKAIVVNYLGCSEACECIISRLSSRGPSLMQKMKRLRVLCR